MTVYYAFADFSSHDLNLQGSTIILPTLETIDVS